MVETTRVVNVVRPVLRLVRVLYSTPVRTDADDEEVGAVLWVTPVRKDAE